MIARRYEVGMIVTHPNRPEWGPGRVLAVQGDAVTVYFRDLPITTAVDATKTIRVRVVHLVPADSQHDPWLDAIPPLRDGVLQLPKPHATPGQAMKAFLEHFEEGCRGASYFTSERSPVWSAHESLRASLGDGQGEAMLAEGRVSEVLEKLRVVKRTANLLSTAERAMVAALLADSESVREYLRALFDATHPPGPAANHVKALLSHRWAVSAGLRPETAWAAVTLFPFLARPDRFMFVRADVIPKAADRLGFDIHYAAEPNWATYQRVLALGAAIIELLASVGGRDHIDAFAFARSVAAMTTKSLMRHVV